ncbi:MAG: phosphoribosylformylglycinamidine synthase subunit PurS [Deltaproteobacteria bacterium]|nr:phosphoribosylformylglycinamidine synthase subunit PurS [Deltaproteobacteria bacterium]
MKDFNVKVEVKLKSVVLDPQGKTVLSALHKLGYNQVIETRVGKLIELKVRNSNKQNVKGLVEEMCNKLLANPVIEEFIISID